MVAERIADLTLMLGVHILGFKFLFLINCISRVLKFIILSKCSQKQEMLATVWKEFLTFDSSNYLLAGLSIIFTYEASKLQMVQMKKIKPFLPAIGVIFRSGYK